MKLLKIFSIFSFLLISSQLFSQNKTDTTMIVNGVCGMCEKKIETAALEEGAKTAEWDVESKVLTLSYNSKKTNLASISDAINAVGYDTEYEAASEEEYNSLHECCKYRDPKVVDDHTK